ncbi:DNA topoisomerase III [Peptococcaceae bacterium 1198_IL3148]
MGKTLVLAEKPSVARDIAAVLGKFRKADGFMEGEQYIVTWAVGHLVELAEPEDYNPALKKWHVNTLPIVPETFKLKPNKQTHKQFAIVKELLHRPDVADVVNACDAGREGELIYRYIMRLADCSKPSRRLWLSETTPEAIKKAFAVLRSNGDFDLLGYAAEARSQADWLVGINATRAFTVRQNTLLSVGRVQTPTLALIVNREREIRDFKPEPYWQLVGEFIKTDGQSYHGKWFKGKQNRFIARDQAMAMRDKLVGQEGKVIDIKQKQLIDKPPFLFNLNDLQKQANRKFGMSAQRTLNIAQSLYEKHKLLTYPRTDSRYLTKELANSLPGRIRALSQHDPYNNFAERAARVGKLGARYVNDAKVTDHHAIITTNVVPNFGKLSGEEQKIYDLVARRFLAVFFNAAQYMQTTIITDVLGETFSTKGKVVLDLGWREVYQPVENNNEDDDNTVLPVVTKGEAVKTENVELSEKETKSPKRYTDASLLAAMEGASRLVDDKELKSTMKGSGLGTPATRAAIIERLIKVGYIERQKKNLLPTAKGETLIDLVPELVKSPEMTGRWEKTLADIEEGSADPQEFMEGIIAITHKIVDLAKSQQVTDVSVVNESVGKCPLCGRAVVEGKKGYGCSGYKAGCQFIIWKEVAKKKLTEKQVQKLLTDGRTGEIKGFTSKAGKKFNASLMLDQNGKVKFYFSQHPAKSVGKCPLCGRDVVELPKGYGCSGYKAGCKFVVWKQIAGQNIALQHLRELLQNGRTEKIEGFVSRSGNKFAAALVLNNGIVELSLND